MINHKYVDEKTAEEIRAYNKRKQDWSNVKRQKARRKIEDIKLAKEVGLDYEDVQKL